MPVRLISPRTPSRPGTRCPATPAPTCPLAEDVELAPFQRALVGTGVAVAIPEGYAGFVHPRSGLAHRLGLSLVNAPGTIDAGYRGEIKVNLINLDPTTPLTLRRGDRIAQLVVQPVVRARFVPVDGAARQRARRGRARLHRRPRLRPDARSSRRAGLTCRSDGGATGSTAACASGACPRSRSTASARSTRPRGPWDEADAPAGRPHPHRPRRPAAAGPARAWTCGSSSTRSRRSSRATLRDGRLAPAGLGVRRAAGRRHLGRASARTSRRAPPGRAGRCARSRARSAPSSPARSSRPRRRSPAQPAAAAGPPPGPVPRRRRPALVPARA